MDSDGIVAKDMITLAGSEDMYIATILTDMNSYAYLAPCWVTD